MNLANNDAGNGSLLKIRAYSKRGDMMTAEPEETILGAGRYLKLRRTSGWEWVERIGVTGIAVIVAVTADGQAVLVEQYRLPVQARMIQWPAGLVGDGDSTSEEHLLDAPNHELQEETGFRAGQLELLTEGPPSAGQSSEIVSFVLASELERVAEGGGVGDEDIQVHLVPLAEIDGWLNERAAEGLLIDPKVYTGLYFLAKREKS